MIFLATLFLLVHEWYEPACCNETHCHQVEDGVVREKVDGVWIAGYGVLSYGDPRLRWSRDNNDHLCVDTASKSPKLLCVYRKPKDM